MLSFIEFILENKNPLIRDMRKADFPEEHRKLVYDMRREGQSETHIADKLGYHVRTIKNHVDSDEHKNRTDYVPKADQQGRVTRELADRHYQLAFKLRKQGLTDHKISKVLFGNVGKRSLTHKLDHNLIKSKYKDIYHPKNIPTKMTDDVLKTVYSLRKEKKYSHDEIADRVGVSVPTLLKYADHPDNIEKFTNTGEYSKHHPIPTKLIKGGIWIRKNN